MDNNKTEDIYFIDDYKNIQSSIEFILSHFENQHELFPRTIMTFKTKGQKKINYESDIQNCKDKIFAFFKQASFKDCKINAFPFNSEHTGIELQVKNKTKASFIMIDLDLNDFEGGNKKEKLNNQLNRTIRNLSNKFYQQVNPSILWTGNGYHIYLPIEGIIFEEYQIFYDYLAYIDNRNLTTEFLRFAEKFFTKGKADPKHLPSVKSCLVRVPLTFNSKNGEQVKIIQRWDGKRPAIQWITRDFKKYLAKKKREKIKEKREDKRKQYSSNHLEGQKNRIVWIEKLLQTPIEDARKQCLWRILCPYLVNIRKVTNDESMHLLNEWINKCDHIKKIDFDANSYIKNDLKNVKGYLPPSKEKLKNQYVELYYILKNNNIFLD
ncbi:MAG: DNA primase noncatalytic subunit PriX [Candidatus Nitrosocosmicus sp.]